MSVARHTAYNLAGYLSPLAVSLVTVPMYLRYVGLERYGLLAICWTLLGFMSFLSLGMGPAVTQRLAADRSSSARDRSQIFWSAALVNFAMACAGGLIIFLLGNLYFNTVQVTNPQLRMEVQQALPWLALAFVVSLASGVLNGTLQGRRWFGVLNGLGIATSIAAALLPLAAAIILGAHVRTLVVATLLVSVCSFALQFAACARAVPLVGVPSLSRAIVRQLASYGGWMTITSLLVPVVMLSDRLAIGSRLGSAAVPIYVIPYNLASRVLALPASVSSATLPKLAAANPDDEHALKSSGLRVLLAALTPLCVAGNMIMGLFLHVWIGDAIAGPATIVGCILVFGFWMHGVGHIPSTVLMGRGRPDLIAKLYLSYLVPYFAALFGLMHFFGITGAAVAWSVRSSMDMVLFPFTGITRRQVVETASCAVLVLASSVLGAMIDWHRPIFLPLLIPLLAISAFVGWKLAPQGLLTRLTVVVPWPKASRAK